MTDWLTGETPTDKIDCPDVDDTEDGSSGGKCRLGGLDSTALMVLFVSFLFSALLAGSKVVRVFYLKEMLEKRTDLVDAQTKDMARRRQSNQAVDGANAGQGQHLEDGHVESRAAAGAMRVGQEPSANTFTST